MENRILDKCPQCGFAISEKKRRCEHCGLPVSAMLKMATQTVQPPPASEPDREPEVPDWRREVSEKVKAYGERKRTLLTPPSPISSAAQPEPRSTEESYQKAVTAPQEHGRPQSPGVSRPSPPAAPSTNPLAPSRAEIWHTDFEELSRNLDQEEETEGTKIFLIRRTVSLLIDNTIIIVLYLVVVFLLSYLFSFDIAAVAKSSWPSVAAVFLLAHCLYYVYFYSTSRQTPGQVFVALEVKDPNSARIDLGKILIRWSVMVGLNLLNLLPIFFNKKYLLSDKLSGTEIRSF